MNPLMPKGVEHVEAIERTLEDRAAMNPLMPKGVEHLDVRITGYVVPVAAMNPLMPQGVEHSTFYAAAYLRGYRDEPSDAERR